MNVRSVFETKIIQDKIPSNTISFTTRDLSVSAFQTLEFVRFRGIATDKIAADSARLAARGSCDFDKKTNTQNAYLKKSNLSKKRVRDSISHEPAIQRVREPRTQGWRIADLRSFPSRSRFYRADWSMPRNPRSDRPTG